MKIKNKNKNKNYYERVIKPIREMKRNPILQAWAKRTLLRERKLEKELDRALRDLYE